MVPEEDKNVTHIVVASFIPKPVRSIVPARTHSCRHTALSEISNRIVGKILQCTFFSSVVGFTNIVVQSMGQSGAEETKYGVLTV